MFYDRFSDLCRAKGVSVSRGAQEAGISKSLVSKWKANQVDIPSADVLSKLGAYFGLSLSELLEESAAAPRAVPPAFSREDLKFALFSGRTHITDSMLEEVMSFAEYVAQREERKNK